MASLGGTHDASNGETMGDTSPLPAGKYAAQIVKSEVRETKNFAQTGNRFVNLEFEVIEGDMKGRRFWAVLNLWNQNAQAVEIAQRELNTICHAVGKLRVADTEELHHRPMLVRLAVEKNDRGEGNRVKGYEPYSAAASGGAFSGGAAKAGGGATASAPQRGPWAS